MRYRHRPTEVDAVQWFKAGDHPAVMEPCELQRMHHRNFVVKTRAGFLKDVRPGDFVLTLENGTHEVLSAAEFEALYEAVGSACTPDLSVPMHHRKHDARFAAIGGLLMSEGKVLVEAGK